MSPQTVHVCDLKFLSDFGSPVGEKGGQHVAHTRGEIYRPDNVALKVRIVTNIRVGQSVANNARSASLCRRAGAVNARGGTRKDGWCRFASNRRPVTDDSSRPEFPGTCSEKYSYATK